MESIMCAASASSPLCLCSAVNPRPSVPSRVPIGRLRSHNYRMIKPQRRERRSKDWWRSEVFSGLDPNTEENQGPTREEDPMCDEELAEELEVLEKEAIESCDEGREPSDYDRRAQIFDESSRVFKALKEKSENGLNGGDGNSS